MSTIRDDFGPRLRNLRLRVGMTQADLAAASELGQSTISALETGRQAPWPSTRRALSRAFRLSIEGFESALDTENALRRAPESSGGEFVSASTLDALEQRAAHDRLLLSGVALVAATDPELRLIALGGTEGASWIARHGSPKGRSLHDVLGDDPVLEAALLSVARGTSRRLMMRLDRTSGPALVCADARFDSGGAPIGLTVVVLDLDDRDGVEVEPLR